MAIVAVRRIRRQGQRAYKIYMLGRRHTAQYIDDDGAVEIFVRSERLTKL